MRGLDARDILTQELSLLSFVPSYSYLVVRRAQMISDHGWGINDSKVSLQINHSLVDVPVPLAHLARIKNLRRKAFILFEFTLIIRVGHIGSGGSGGSTGVGGVVVVVDCSTCTSPTRRTCFHSRLSEVEPRHNPSR